MRHEYYGYDKETHRKAHKRKMYCLKDNETEFRQMACQMAEEI